jgi:hypothetical protein
MRWSAASVSSADSAGSTSWAGAGIGVRIDGVASSASTST